MIWSTPELSSPTRFRGDKRSKPSEWIKPEVEFVASVARSPLPVSRSRASGPTWPRHAPEATS